MYFEAHNLYKKWDDFIVDVSFSAQKGSFTSIVGKSGSGKSTLLRIIAGILKSDSPQTKIMLDNKDITSLPLGKRDCGMVFQSPSLFQTMNVLENVAYGLRCQGFSKKDAHKKACEYLERFEIEHLASRDTENLSGGEAGRVSLARSLIVSPKLLLLDEPFSALDETLRKKLGEELKKQQQELGFTAIMITHDLTEAKFLSDTIITMEQGRVL